MDIGRIVRTRILPSIGLGDPRHARLGFIEAYRFPGALLERFAAEHREFSTEERADVFEGLRDFFAICAADPGRSAGMPSRIVDEAWHTFILFTREYSDFCERAFGRYLHHAPTAMGANDDELKRTWRIACAREGIPASVPARLPRLFAIDRRLNVQKGNYYALNETDAQRLRRNMEVNSVILFAGVLAGGETWTDPIFAERAGGGFTPMGGEAAFANYAGGDAGAADTGGDIGGGGCSGGGN